MYTLPSNSNQNLIYSGILPEKIKKSNKLKLHVLPLLDFSKLK